MYPFIRNIIEKLPVISRIVHERDELRSEITALRGSFPPGHYYSPIPSIEEIQKNEGKIFGKFSSMINGIELYEADQLKLLEKFLEFYNDMPFPPDKRQGFRYYFENPAYSYSDAIMYYCMLRYLKPKRIIEVGSGFSSCLALDTNELFFDRSIAMTFIEPYPETLRANLKDSDEQVVNLLPTRLQEIELTIFEKLEPNDILFVDSTHVSKICSDVNVLFFEILPRLSSGVYIHFHDIFYPFEYPKEWLYQGIMWNEAYLLRAFLEFNEKFHIVLMNTFMEIFHEPFFKQYMPLCCKNTGGSIWIRKL